MNGDRIPRRRFALATVCALVLVVQVLLPLRQLLLPTRPAQWGWQMYSGPGAGAVRYKIVEQDGRHVPVNLEDHLVEFRGDIQLEDYIPAHLCETTTAAAVLLERLDEPPSEVACP